MNNISISKELIKIVENKILDESSKNQGVIVQIGDIVKLQYKIPDGDKERIQSYEGLIIA